MLKRKTEEAEAAKKRLRELMEVQARARCGGRGGRMQQAATRTLPLPQHAGAACPCFHTHSQLACRSMYLAIKFDAACNDMIICCPANRNQRGDAVAARTGDMEMQPNAGAPLLRTERARREWVEQELDLCNTSWEYMKVGEGASPFGTL